MPRLSKLPAAKLRKGGRKRIKPGTVYGPFTVGEPVGFKEYKIVLRKYSYAVTCRCGEKYEKWACDLHQAREAGGCMKCTTKSRGVPGKVERNRAMAADRAAGMLLPDIVKKYGVTKQRAAQIIKREKSRG